MMLDKYSYRSIIRSAESGDIFFQTLIGFLLEHGFGTVADQDAAKQWYARSAEQNFAPAQYLLSLLLLDKGEVDEGLAWLEKAANLRYALAQSKLGLLYIEGIGVEPDSKSGFVWMKKAAEQGSTTALRQLSKMYGEGIGVRADAERASQYLRQAAEKGDPGAAYLLGTSQIELEDKRSLNEGKKWIWKAAEASNTYANMFLSQMYDHGLHGESRNKDLARHFLNRAKKSNLPGDFAIFGQDGK